MGKREFGEEEVIDVQEEAVDTSDVSADNMISAKELEAREKKEARKQEWADNKIMLRERKGEMYEVLLANGFDQAYCDGLQKIIGETYVKKARTKSSHVSHSVTSSLHCSMTRMAMALLARSSRDGHLHRCNQAHLAVSARTS